VLTSTVPVVVERSEYVGPPNLDLAWSGSVLTGSNGGGTTWLFPSASADPRDDARLYLFNPSLNNARLLATFYSDNGGIAQRHLTLAANAYSSVAVSVPRVARGGQIGAMLTTQGGQAIVAELGGYNDDFKEITAGAGIP
jgi:hypothetical protein